VCIPNQSFPMRELQSLRLSSGDKNPVHSFAYFAILQWI
jgi:hypothetical protein